MPVRRQCGPLMLTGTTEPVSDNARDLLRVCIQMRDGRVRDAVRIYALAIVGGGLFRTAH